MTELSESVIAEPILYVVIATIFLFGNWAHREIKKHKNKSKE